MGVVDIVQAIGALVFGPVFAVLLVLCAIAGALLPRLLERLAPLVFVIGVSGMVAWYMGFVFPYPPIGTPSAWMMAGYDLTEPLGTTLAARYDIRNLERQKRFGQMVYKTEGDPNKIWTGDSIDKVRLLGQISLLLVALGLGSLAGRRILKWSSPKEETG